MGKNRRFDIISGPTLIILFANLAAPSLIKGKPNEVWALFDIMVENKFREIQVRLSGMVKEDGSGHNWLLSGYCKLDINYPHTQSITTCYYNSEKGTGFIELE